jgi:glutamine synthetase
MHDLNCIYECRRRNIKVVLYAKRFSRTTFRMISPSLWKKRRRKSILDSNGYALISPLARYYIGGLLKHAQALMAFCAPTTNSYKRLVPGFEAPVNLVYSMRNRSAAVRIPVYTDNPKSKRIEFRPPDCTCNPYLSFAALLMAGLDGIAKQIDPGEPLDKNIYELESNGLATVPLQLDEAITALEQIMTSCSRVECYQGL